MAFLQSGGSIVTSSNIVDGTIVDADIAAAAAIALTKLAGADGNGYNANILDPAELAYRVVQISSADILAMSTVAGPELIPNPGAGKIAIPLSIVLVNNFNSIAYSGGFTSNIYWGTQTTVLGAGSISSAFVNSAADAVMHWAADGGVVATLGVNQPVIWRLGSGSSFITGNGTFTAHVIYRVITL